MAATRRSDVGYRPTFAEKFAAWRSDIALRPAGPWTGDAVALMVLTATLTLLGLLMSLSASFALDAVEGSAFATFRKQAVYAVVGVAVYFFAARTDHRLWRTLAWPMLGVSVLGLVAVLVPGVGLEQYGSVRWIAVGPLVVQPSELAKLATLLWLADIATRKRHIRGLRDDRILPLKHQLIPAVPLYVVLATLLMAEPDFGTTALVGLIVGLVLWWENIPMRWVLGGLGIAAVGAVVAINTAGYRAARITGWLHAEETAAKEGYQLMQSLYALGNGGVFGTGLGASRAKWSFIPNPETDFVFAIIGEELGAVGALTTLALFAAILIVGLRIANRCTDRFGKLVAGVATAWLVGQALLNIGTVTGLMPITGVTLPLVSVGGSSLVSTLLALGIVTAVAKSTDGPADHR